MGLERRVRLQWISDKLIEVRLARLANSKGPSADLMQKILKSETDWELIPIGAVYATQAEETGYLSDFIQREIYISIEKKQPLAALLRFQTNRNLLEDVLKIKTERLKSTIANSGREFCENEVKSVTRTDYYRALFLREACVALQHTTVIPKTKNSVRLFADLTPEIQVRNAPPESVSDFSRDLKIEFEKSIWHDPHGEKPLGLKLSGELIEKISIRPVYRSKSYTVQIPDEEKSIRKKTSRTGLETVFEVLAWALTTYQPNREHDNGDGTVTVTETKYRDESRLFPYQADEITQDLTLDLKIELAPQDLTHSFTFKDRLKTVSDEHSVRFSDAGLAPEVRRLIPPAQWLVSLNRKIMDRLSSEFNDAWIERFCGDTGSTALAAIETQHRCIYGANGRAPSGTREWFAKRYGIEIETWRQLVTMRK
jgi:hypothetical protein